MLNVQLSSTIFHYGFDLNSAINYRNQAVEQRWIWILASDREWSTMYAQKREVRGRERIMFISFPAEILLSSQIMSGY